MQSLFGSGNISLMQKSLDSLWLRQKLISNNIANIDTPGYKSKSVNFEDVLQNQLGASSSLGDFYNKAQSVNPQIVENNSTSMRADGNNVDIDSENIELVKTQIQYQYLARMISNDIARTKYVLSEGK